LGTNSQAVHPLREETPTTPLFCGLARQGRGPHCRYTLVGRGNEPLSEKAIWTIVDRRVQQAGIKGQITPHSARHTFITLALIEWRTKEIYMTTTRWTISGSDAPALSPGETLQQILEERGMPRMDLASRLELPLERVSSIVTGKEPVSQEIALQLAQIFGHSARFFQR
jgi:hypothetical protein